MKINIHPAKRRQAKAFTLIEMIGVLAVIAILAALLIPKIFDAINNARVNNTAVSYNTVKAAVMDHYAKFGTLLSSNGTAMVTTDAGALTFDRTLLTEGFLDKPFQVKIGDGTALTHIEIASGSATNIPVSGINAAYDLDGNDSTVNDASPASAVVQAVITGVTEADARDLNDRLDGASLGGAVGAADLKGRVKYAAVPSGGTTTVYVYLSHR